MVEVGGVWELHPDWWECREGVNYVRAWLRARWLASVLLDLASAEFASRALRLAAELYGAGLAVRADGTAVAWIGVTPDDAELTAEIPPGAMLPVLRDALPLAS